MAIYTHYDSDGGVLSQHEADFMKFENGIIMLYMNDDAFVAVISLLAGQSVSRDRKEPQ